MQMNKVVGMCIVTLFIATSILPIVGSETKTTTNYSAENNDCGCAYHPYAQGFFHSPVMIEIPDVSDVGVKASSIALMDTPEYFNWMDYEGKDWTTPARDQRNCGSCWDFAAIGVLESVINIREGLANLDPDLSEQYVLSCIPKAGNCLGGDAANTFKYILSNSSSGNYCNGIIPEACFPYQAIDTVSCDDKMENWQDYLVPILDYGNLPGNQIETVKSVIMEKGPVAALIVVDENFTLWYYTHHSPEDYFPYNVSSTMLNHAIVLVGWKDDPSIGRGGYWICKNSWGPLGGYNGCFNIEYDSLRINGAFITWVDYDPESYDWQPVPRAYGPYYGLTNQSLQFTGDAGGEHPPFTWLWDFGDGAQSNEQNPTHIYLSKGDYTVTLTATDDKGKSFSTTTSAWIQTANHPPMKPSIVGPTSIKPNEMCWYNISSSDPDGTPVYIYTIVFDIDSGVWWGPYAPGEMDRSNWYWPEKGDYTVKAKAKDPYGTESDWATLEVSVSKDKATLSTPFLRFLEYRPYLFPLFRQLIGE
jgi:C1A family cysteine protease